MPQTMKGLILGSELGVLWAGYGTRGPEATCRPKEGAGTPGTKVMPSRCSSGDLAGWCAKSNQVVALVITQESPMLGRG